MHGVVQDVRPWDEQDASAVDFRRLTLVVVGISVALSVASMALPVLIHHPLTRDQGEIRRYFAVFEEGNLPTWWSTGLLVVAALAHAMTGAVARTAGSRTRWSWFASAGVLGLLSLDDHTALHERLERVGRQIVTFERFPAYWLIPGVLAGAAVAGALLLLAVRLRGPARWCLVGGCAMLLGAAMGGELAHSLLYTVGESGPVYVLTLHAEELGENVGVLLMIAAAIRSTSIARRAGTFVVRYLQD